MKIEKKVESLEKEADSLTLEAETKESFQTLAQANALRAEAKSFKSWGTCSCQPVTLRFRERVKVIGWLVFIFTYSFKTTETFICMHL